jgi:hypothetical protein
MLQNLVAIFPLLSNAQRTALRESWKLLDIETLRQFENIPQLPLNTDEVAELQRLIALRSCREFPK